MLHVVAQQTVTTPNVEWSLLWPLIILSLAGVLLITITSVVPATRGGGFPAGFTAASAILAMALIPFTLDRVDERSIAEGTGVLSNAIVVDHFTLFITGIIGISVVFAAFLLDDYLRREGLEHPEWYALVLLSAAGGVLLASAEDLILAFVGLEVLSIAVYVLAALHLRRADSQEAGFKYFVLGALSSAIFLYGIALVYGATGSTRLSDIHDTMFRPGLNGLVPGEDSSMILVGIAFLLVGFGFKVSAAPFHVWTPDVYQGSPTPVVAFMASAVKVAAFAGFLRVFLRGFVDLRDEWLPIVFALAVLTLVVGSVLAVVQTDIKRMMAYSSITHAGFMLIGLHSAAEDSATDILGSSSILFYLFTYSIMVIGTFAVITVMGRTGDGAHSLDGYRGLYHRQPLVASLFVILLFGQAGIPFTSGFFAKFRVIAAASSDEQYWLAGVAMLAAVVAAYLYLRVVVAMFLDDGTAEAGAEDAETVGASAEVDAADEEILVPPSVFTVLAICAVVTVVLGILPDLGGGFLDDAAETLALFAD